MTSPASRFSLNGALGVSLLAIALVTIFLLSGVSTILATALSSGTGGVKSAEEVDKLVALHKDQVKTYQDRFNGRSAFYKPPPKIKPFVKQDDPTPPPPPPPPPPPGPPAKYNGPSIAFAIGETVWFKAATGSGKPFKVAVGETSNGVKVLSTTGPWTVKVAYGGGEYDVPLFPASDTSAIMPSTAKPSSLPPGIVPVIEGAPTPSLKPAAPATSPAATAPAAGEDEPAEPTDAAAEDEAAADQEAERETTRPAVEAPHDPAPAPNSSDAGRHAAARASQPPPPRPSRGRQGSHRP